MTCEICTPGKFSVEGSAVCTNCSLGESQPSSGATACTACPAGTHASETSGTRCVECEAGSYSPLQMSTSCTQCPPGTYSEQPRANASDFCMLCPAGKASLLKGSGSHLSCQDCQAQTFAPAGSSECALCPQYTTSLPQSTNGTSCRCNAGYMGADGGPCLACQGGWFKADVGSGACIACALGSSSDTTAATSSETCLECAAGKYADVPGLVRCRDCWLGKYSLGRGAIHPSSCIGCQSGKFLAVMGADSAEACQSCIGGKYSYSGYADCTDCPLLASSEPESDGPERCECPVGHWAPVGADCIECVAGKYLNTTGRRSNECVSCNPGQFSDSGASTCIDCPQGQFSEDAGSGHCLFCPQDSYNDEEGVTTCKPCTLDLCSSGEYRFRCQQGSVEDGPCKKCTYKQAHTMFIGDGEYNDTCPYVCEPPYKEDCATGRMEAEFTPVPQGVCTGRRL